MDLMEREKGRSKAFRLKNVIDVARTLRLLCALEWGTAGDESQETAPGRVNRTGP